MDSAIVVSNIEKRFGKTVALKNLNYRSAKGVNIILGPNGAGKSTLLRCIDGLYRVESGKITVLGVDPYRDDTIKSRLSLLTDNYALYDFLSVRNNLGFFGRLYGMSDEATLAKSMDLLKKLDALEYLDRKVYELSRGTKQKVAFCRAVLNDPEIILLDEPTAFLDAHSADMVRKILLGYEKEGKTIVFVTQKLDEVTRFDGKISIIRAGRIVKETTTEGLYKTVLKNTMVNIRLAKPLNHASVKKIPGFVDANQNKPTLIKFQVRNYRDIARILKELLALVAT